RAAQSSPGRRATRESAVRQARATGEVVMKLGWHGKLGSHGAPGPRRPFRAALAAAALLVGALAAAAPAAAQQRPFRLIVTELETPLVPNSVMELALQLGYFEREGVNVQLVRVQLTPSAVTALVAGEGEMANIAVDAVLQATAAGILDA